MSNVDWETQTIRNQEGIIRAEGGQIGVLGDKVTVVRKVVSHFGPIIPIWTCELEKLDWVWLNIDSEVDEVHDGMEPSLDKDESANKFVEVDVVVQRQDRGQTQVSEHGDAVSED